MYYMFMYVYYVYIICNEVQILKIRAVGAINSNRLVISKRKTTDLVLSLLTQENRIIPIVKEKKILAFSQQE